MLKISHLTSIETSDIDVLKVEGQGIGQSVDELRRVCQEALEQRGREHARLVLDLDGLSFLDNAGVALFRELAARNVSFTNCSVFIAEQLKEVCHDRR